MGANPSAYRGCLLGLAAGDALGHTVDEKTWDEICADYGPNGLLGYDLVNGSAEVTSYTQLVTYLSNAMLLSISRGVKDNFMPFIHLGLKEWVRSQQYYRDPERSFCWVAKLPAFRRRHCRDSRMLESLRLQSLGAIVPRNNYDTPSALTAGVAVGLFFEERRMDPAQIGQITAKTVSLSHGHPDAWLSAVVLAYTIAGLLQEPELPLETQFRSAIAAMQGQFPGEPGKALAARLKRVITIARNPSADLQAGMEALGCNTAAECLAGAMYACLTVPDDFDAALILAVNHSGHSAATGALTGAILGARLGHEALPEFYLESLEGVEPLCVLAEDLYSSTPAMGLFDDDWDQKYVQGIPL